jgi:hypothetical protein
MASASGGPAPAKTAIVGADQYIIPPDTDIGLPMPPGDDFLEEFVEVWVYQPSGPPNNWSPLLCPRKKMPDNNQTTQVRANGDPQGGDYYWSGGGWTATGPEPFFNSASTGDYIAHVHYEVQGEGEADDDSGYIHVFDAELTLDGTPDNTEDSPGAFLAKGSARKLLTLTTVPADPDGVMPDGFQEGQPHNDRAPYTVTLSRGGAVEIYSQPTGGQHLTGDALEWGWKYNPQTQKYVEQNPPYPTQLYVEPVSAGSGDLELTLIYRTVNECPGWAPDTGGSGTDRTTDRVKVTVVDAQVESVTFVSDHGVLTDWNTNFAAGGGDLYNPRGWHKDPPANNPVSHTQGLNVTVEVGVTISPAGVQYKLSGVSGVNGLDFQQQDAVTSTGALQTFHLTSSQDDKLDAKVAVVQTPIHWQASLTDAVNLGDSGPHKLYVTWGSPGNGPTLKRIDHVCTHANGAGSQEAIADALQTTTATHTVFLVGGTTDGWALLDGGAGDCDNQARCMGLQVEMLGAGPAVVRLVRASTNGGAGNCLDQEDREGPPHQWLVLDFNTGTGYDWNAYEGCCETAGHYYAIHPQIKADNDYQLLLALPCQQYWITTVGDVQPGTPGCQVEQVIEEVGKPY